MRKVLLQHVLALLEVISLAELIGLNGVEIDLLDGSHFKINLSFEVVNFLCDCEDFFIHDIEDLLFQPFLEVHLDADAPLIREYLVIHILEGPLDVLVLEDFVFGRILEVHRMLILRLREDRHELSR